MCCSVRDEEHVKIPLQVSAARVVERMAAGVQAAHADVVADRLKQCHGTLDSFERVAALRALRVLLAMNCWPVAPEIAAAQETHIRAPPLPTSRTCAANCVFGTHFLNPRCRFNTRRNINIVMTLYNNAIGTMSLTRPGFLAPGSTA